MPKSKLNILVLLGGTNTEHEVSLVSGRAILDNLDPAKYAVTPIKINKDNTWTTLPNLAANYHPAPTAKIKPVKQSVTTIKHTLAENKIDIVFPVLHGPYGEDGTIQGMLELLRLPYVGCGVSASTVCMDKVLQKNICRDYQLPVMPFYWFTQGRWDQEKAQIQDSIRRQLPGYPLFVKPANQGSSVGITKVKTKQDLSAALKLALTRDTKVIVEQGVDQAREIECAVLGPNHAPETSVLGEIIPHAEYYDYETKYLNDNSEAVIPAKLNSKLTDSIQQTARLAYEVLGCDGLARIDFLLDQHGNYYLNELNTMPGFTPISMYPKLWEASGLSYPDLLDKLIDLALVRHQTQQQINLSR